MSKDKSMLLTTSAIVSCRAMKYLYHSVKIFFLVLTDAGGPLELGDIEVHRQISIMTMFIVFNKI